MQDNFFQFIEVITQEQLLTYLDCGSSAMWEQIRLKDDPFSWVNGIHYFQPTPKGKVTFNKRMVEVWLTAKCQRDPSLHINAVQRFQQLHPGSAVSRGRKNIA